MATTSRQKWTVLAACVAGVVVGVAGSVAASRITDSEAARSSDAGRGQQRERRLAEMGARRRSSGGASSREDERARDQAAVEEERAALQQEYEKKIRDHYLETIDSSWANRVTIAYEEDLAKIAKAGRFEVDKVDCRERTCVADLRWETYAGARAGYMKLAGARYREGCAHGIVLLDPADAAAPYTATAVFDCTEVRQKAAQPAKNE